MSKRLILPLLLLSLLGTSGTTLAQDLAKMEADGWRVVKDGVLQREIRAGEIETFVYGVEGFTWKLQDLRSHLRKLRNLSQASPTPELRKAIENHRKEIANTIKALELARDAEGNEIPKSTCTFDLAYNADANPRNDLPGTWASADSSFYASPACSYTGEVYAYAFAKTTLNGGETTQTATDGPRSGSNVSASAYAQRTGGGPCESYSYSSVTSYNLNPSSYSRSRQNYSCAAPPVPLQVVVTSSHNSNLTLYTGVCLQIGWSVSNSNGNPPYTTRIYLNNVFKTTGTNYGGEWICAPAAGVTETYTVRADVTDSLGRTGSGSHTTTITGRAH